MDTAFRGLILLLGLSLACGSFGILMPYFIRPEDFFIKRLRPKSGDRITHKQLLVRAFIGVGLVSSGAWVLGYLLVVGLVSRWIFGAWLPTTLGGGLIVGTGAYIYFRFRRYRKQAPDERESTVDGAASVFVRRID